MVCAIQNSGRSEGTPARQLRICTNPRLSAPMQRRLLASALYRGTSRMVAALAAALVMLVTGPEG